MDKARKTVVIILLVLASCVAAGFIYWGLTYAVAMTLYILSILGGIGVRLLLSIAIGIGAVTLISMGYYISGGNNTLFEKYFVTPLKTRKEKKEKKRAVHEAELAKMEADLEAERAGEVSDWPTLAETAINEISTKLEKLEPGDDKGLCTLMDDCTDKVRLIEQIMDRGNAAKEEAKLFENSYKEKRLSLLKVEDQLVEEISELKEKSDPISKVVRTDKTSDLLDVQAKIKELEAQRKHHQYLSDTVGATRLVVKEAANQIKYMVAELNRKQQRRKILGA